MHRTRSSHRWIALGIAALVTVSGCSGTEKASPAPGSGSTSGTGSTPGSGSATGTSPSGAFTGRSPETVERPATEGKGIVLPQPAAPLPEGYVQEEYLVGGTATSFDPVDTPDNGFWTARPGKEAAYRTRAIVRRPADPARFSGTVLVEWFNVSAIEAAPDWGYLSQEIGREGHAYIGVSAQAQGVEGGKTILDVNVDANTASSTGFAADTSGLKNIDPARYASLVHPGDAYSFDIFSQIGRAASESPDTLLAGLAPKQVLAVGESQSAIFLSTLVNAVHPLDPVFDGFLIHSRGANVAPLNGDFLGAAQGQNPEEVMKRGVLMRTDLTAPILLFEAETDLTLLGYAHARQPDTDRVRTWEVAGTAHADAHTLRSILGGPRDPGIGSLLGCGYPINAGPHHEVVQAALHRLVEWTAGGAPPPAGARLELVEGDEVVIARDERQIAKGGVRNPLVDTPVAAYIDDPPAGASIADLADGGGDLCILFGRTIAFDRATLVGLHGTADGYLTAFRKSADAAVAAGFLLRADADELIAEAEANRALFG